MPSRNISRETLKSQACLIGLNIEGAELDSLVARTRVALSDIDALDELDLASREPAVAFARANNRKGDSQ